MSAPAAAGDVIVVGGGHNGLVCAAYLARAGRGVLVLEAREQVGGAAVTEEFAPGFRASTVADGAGRLFPRIARDLDLQRHGLRYLPADPALAALQPDSLALTLWADPRRTADSLARFSKADAARYPEFLKQMSRIALVVAGLMQMTPPDLPDISPGDMLEALKVIGPARRLSKAELNQVFRVLPMSMADLLDEWFESAALKGALAADGLRGLSLGPRQAGTVYVWLTGRAIGARTGLVQGGLGALTGALAGAARAHGAVIRTGARVARVIVRAGRAAGVVLASGQEIAAAVVVSNADPRTTFRRLFDPMDVDPVFLRALSNIKYRGAAASMHLALEGLPRFGLEDPAWPGLLRIAPSLDYLERASDAVKYGQFSEQPYLDLSLPTLADPSLAPPGKHVLSIFAQYAPYHLRGANWDGQRAALAQAILATLEGYAPGLRPLISQSLLLTPLDLETRYGLPEGSGAHGEMTLDQVFHMRPVPGFARYRMPIAGLLLCGAGAHPGGGLTGLPGYNAAQALLRSGRA